ncbi:MAG: hypothetical protein ACC742_06465 [Thermoanaerobaculales bacterium]
MNEAQAPIPPHAPDTTGRLRKLLGAFHVTGVFWYKIHCWGLSVLPEWGVYIINNLFTAFFFFALRRIRVAIAGNLEAVLGSCGWWCRQQRIWRTMLTFAWCLSERYEALIADRQTEFAAEGEDTWRSVASTGRGLIVVTAHIGHWEIGSRLPLAHGFRRIHVVREPEVDPKAREFIRDLVGRTSGGGYEVHFADDSDPAFGAGLLAALRKGDVVALQGDRPRAVGQTEVVRLFGRPFELPVGPAALARAAEVPLLPVFVFRESRLQSRVFIRAPITVRRLGDRRSDIRRALQCIADEVEWAIRKAPHQWFCFRELWPQSEES